MLPINLLQLEKAYKQIQTKDSNKYKIDKNKLLQSSADDIIILMITRMPTSIRTTNSDL